MPRYATIIEKQSQLELYLKLRRQVSSMLVKNKNSTPQGCTITIYISIMFIIIIIVLPYTAYVLFYFMISDESSASQSSRRLTSNRVVSRTPSLTVSKSSDQIVDDDTFEHILQVTAQHDAVMAYYYMDEDNKVKVTEIFDVTDSESQIFQTPHEKETNMCLEYDEDEWNDSTMWSTDKAFGGSQGIITSFF